MTDLRLGDCLDPITGLASLPDKSIDVVITDPPYSEHVHSKSQRALTGSPIDLGFKSLDDKVRNACSAQFERLARRWVLVFCDVESVHLWKDSLTKSGTLEYVRTCVWHKPNGSPQFTGDRPGTWGEAIVCAHAKGKKHWNGGGKLGLYAVLTASDRSKNGLDARVHTTQKPLRLMEALVADFTDGGESILDPFAGSGTTLLAAQRLGRNAIGWERDAEIYEHARRALAGEGRAEPDDRQVPLFAGVR